MGCRAVNPLALGIVGEGVRTLLDRLFPDPAERARAELELRKLEGEGTFAERAGQALALAQIDVNRAEARSRHWFAAGWRPGAGWACVAALWVQFVLAPLVEWGAALAGHPVPPLPKLDAVLWELLFGMLGLGALRSVEKIKGKA